MWLGSLILLAILFRGAVRAIVMLAGAILFIIIIYFGYCFAQWEEMQSSQQQVETQQYN